MKQTHTVVPRMWRFAADWRRYNSHIAVCSLLLILLTSGSVATAQERFSEINGTAMDSSGGVLPNVKVTVTNRVTGRVTETTTTGSGAYQARNLEPGKYMVRFELKGFSTYEVPEVNLLLGKTLTVDAKMTVGNTEQTIQVTDAAPLIDTTNTTMANNITADEFDRLPKARSFQSLALASTSTNSGEIEGGIQVNGASGAENNFTIDGISTTSLLNGQSRQDAVFEILQEVQVKTGGISAEYGGALGGVVSAVTKSGGNSFHGDIHYYLSGNKISAANRKRLLLSPSNDTTTAYYQDAKQKNDNNEIGYALGGYFVKNRLYFYSAASPNFGSRTNDYGFSNGTETGSIDQDSTRHMLFNKLSFDITKSLRGSMHWLWTPTKSTGTLPGYGGECPNCITSSKAANSIRANQGFFAPQSNYGAQLDWTLSSTSLFSVRAGRFWDNYKDVGLPDITPVTYSVTSVGTPGVPPNYIGPSGTTNTPRVARSRWDIVTRTYVQADFNQFFRAGGTHDLKVGIGTQKNVNNVLQDYPTGGYINIFWNRAFTPSVPGVPANQRGTYGYYEYHEFGTGGTTGANINNIYFQDNWRVIPRLTLNLGLRLESERVPSFQRNVKDYAFDFGWGKKIAPRLGASFDVFGTGKLKIYGSWGRYYDWVKYELARGTFGGDYWRVRYRALETADVYSLNSRNLPGRDLWNPAVTDSFRNRRVPGFDTIDPEIKPMASQLFNAGFEYEVAPQTVFRAGYVRNTLIRTIEDLGVLVNGDEVYYYANPGLGGATITPTSGATKPFPTPKAVRNYNAMEVAAHQALRLLVRQRQLRLFAAPRQLLRPRRVRRNPHRRRRRRRVRPRPAEHRRHRPSGRQRQPRLGHRRTTVGCPRRPRSPRPAAHRPPARVQALRLEVVQMGRPPGHRHGRLLVRRLRHSAQHARQHHQRHPGLRERPRRPRPHGVPHADRPRRRPRNHRVRRQAPALRVQRAKPLQPEDLAQQVDAAQPRPHQRRDQPRPYRPLQGVRLQGDDQRHLGRLQGVQPALRDGRLVQSRLLRPLPGEVHLLAKSRTTEPGRRKPSPRPCALGNHTARST